MQLTKTQKIIISIVAVIVLLALYIIFDRRSQNNPVVQNQPTMSAVATTSANVTTKEIGNTGMGVSGSGNFKVDQVAGNVPQPIPSLTAPVSFSGIGLSLTPDVKAMVVQKVSALQSALLKNPADFDSWINLGIYQKMAGDFNATIISWQYAGKLAPTTFISFGDLGDLSAYFLKDTASAEKYYAQAIGNGPTQAYLYIQLAQVQHDIEQNSAKALATVDLGLSKIPNDPSLLQYKAGLSQ